MEVGQGPNWGCSAKEKKMFLIQNWDGKRYRFMHLHYCREKTYRVIKRKLLSLPNMPLKSHLKLLENLLVRSDCHPCCWKQLPYGKFHFKLAYCTNWSHDTMFSHSITVRLDDRKDLQAQDSSWTSIVYKLMSGRHDFLQCFCSSWSLVSLPKFVPRKIEH
jgi:hypothetical protein